MRERGKATTVHGNARNILAVHLDAGASFPVAGEQARGCIENGRFASTVRPHEGEVFATRHLEGSLDPTFGARNVDQKSHCWAPSVVRGPRAYTSDTVSREKAASSTDSPTA